MFMYQRVNVTFYSKRTFVDMIKGFQVRGLSWIIWAALNTVTSILVRGRQRDTKARCYIASLVDWTKGS
jgi:hypothetical protein